MEQLRKHSRKREAILQSLCSTKEHPTAEWIYAALKPSIPDLSLGTVYRNLALFKQEGRIMSVATVNGQERFDGNASPHAHFICTGCGRVLDVGEIETDEARNALVESRLNARVASVELLFKGLCDKCVRLQAQNNKNQ